MHCTVAGCTNLIASHCVKCRKALCARHAEECESSGETFCPSCRQTQRRQARPTGGCGVADWPDGLTGQKNDGERRHKVATAGKD